MRISTIKVKNPDMTTVIFVLNFYIFILARIVCTGKTCDVENMQSASSSSVKGIYQLQVYIHFFSSFTLLSCGGG